MTDQPIYPRIIFPEGSGEEIYDGYIEDNEWFSPEVELENGDRYTLNFYTPLRLSQSLDMRIERGEPWLAEFNVILLPKVTLEAAQQCIQTLWHKGFFEYLKPDNVSR